MSSPMRRFLVSSLLITGSFTPRLATTSALSSSSLSKYSQSTESSPSLKPHNMADASQEAKNPSPMGLPEPSEGATHKLDMSSGSDSITLDHLGPMVVNKDGSLSRIANWEKMAEIERRNTLRIIGKRNQERLKVLKAQGGDGGETSEKSEL